MAIPKGFMQYALLLLVVSTLLVLGACAPITAPVQSTVPAAVAESGPTGIAEVDAIITEILAQDQAAIAELVRFTALPCTTRDGLGGPPKCAEGQSEGDIVHALPMMGTSASYLTQENIANLQFNADALYAVYTMPADAAPFEVGWPVGVYGIVFTTTDPAPVSLTVVAEEGAIVRTSHNFTQSPAEAIPSGAVVIHWGEE